MSASEIAGLIRSNRFHFVNERDLQLGIETVLEGGEVEFEREVRLVATDRIDFLCGRVGIEVKIGGGAAAVIRQLHRYAQCPEIDELILVTTRMLHRQSVPSSLNGKAIHVVSLVRL